MEFGHLVLVLEPWFHGTGLLLRTSQEEERLVTEAARVGRIFRAPRRPAGFLLFVSCIDDRSPFGDNVVVVASVEGNGKPWA